MDDRPVSIVNFERCYLGAFAIGMFNTALSWQATRERLAPQAEQFGSWFMPAVTLIGFAITLTLWYFIARRGSAVAKWIATVFLVLGLLGLLISLPTGNYPQGIGGVFGIVSTVLQVIAIWLLFRPDTKPWFGETGASAA